MATELEAGLTDGKRSASIAGGREEEKEEEEYVVPQKRMRPVRSASGGMGIETRHVCC